MAIALPAIPLIVKFAEVAGIVVSGVATAAGLDKLSNKVEEYIEENPEQSQKIFNMIMPAQGLANILKNESDDGEESSEEEVVESEPGSTKDVVLGAINSPTGSYQDKNATGNYGSKRGRVIRALEDAGKIRKGNDPNYDASKKYQGYKRFIRPKKADGGMMEYANGGGIGSMMEPKRKSFRGGGMDMGNASNQKQSAAMGKSTSAPGPGDTGGEGGNNPSDNSNSQSRGGGGGGGGNNNTPSPKVKKNISTGSFFPTFNFFKKFGAHDKYTNQLKSNPSTTNYHQLGGFDFMARFPDLNPNIAKGLASAYQTIFEGGRAIADGPGGITFEDANKKADEESRLNAVGIDAFSNPESETYKQYYNQPTLLYGSAVPFANGGGVGSMMQRKKFNEGSNWWDTLDAQGMNVYNSMKRGGHDDATIQGQLAMLGYYDPNTTPPDSTPDTPQVVQQLGYQGGDNFSPIKSVTTDPRISAANEADIRNRQLTSMGINDPFADEISLSGAYYGDMPIDTSNLIGKQSMLGKAKQGLSGIVGNVKGLMDNPIGNAIGFAMNPVMGGLKGIASMVGNVMPVNQRSIQENIMGNMGVAVNDIGQIVSTGDYNDPNNVMAGYNLNRMTPATFKNRIDKIRNRSMPQTIASANRIKSIKEAQRRFELGEKLKEERLVEKQLKRAQKEIEAKGYQDYGQGGADQATQDSYNDSQGNYAGASTEDYGGGE